MTIPATMKAGLYFGNDDVRVVERPVPQIGPNEVLASVMVCGICGSDTMKWYRAPQTRKLGGINTGHEIAGQIIQVGENIHNFRDGQRVVITHHFPCLQCASCKDGNETACEARCTTSISSPLTRFWNSQPSILFSYGAAPRDMSEALDHIASGRVRVDGLVTHRFPLNRIGEAFDLVANPRDTSLKIIIEPHRCR
jgi:threonine dehydrogenase-like Zn-dependent dehydrogenase